MTEEAGDLMLGGETVGEPSNQMTTQALRDQVTVVIPTLNEEGAIGRVIEELHEKGYRNVVVVDGYSKDRTVEAAERSGAKVIMQHGVGKSGAFASGFEEVKTRFLVVMDGDGTYDPSGMDRMCKLLGRYDYVKGQRQVGGAMSRLHRFGNDILTRSFNLLFGTADPDVCSGMYALNTELARAIHLGDHPATPDQDILAQVVLNSNRITSVPINYRMRLAGKSKFSTWWTGLECLWTNFEVARKYNPVLLLSSIAALVIIPATALMGYAGYLFLFAHEYHGGYFLGSLVLYVIGIQGLVVAAFDAMLRRMERRLGSKEIV